MKVPIAAPSMEPGIKGMVIFQSMWRQNWITRVICPARISTPLSGTAIVTGSSNDVVAKTSKPPPSPANVEKKPPKKQMRGTSRKVVNGKDKA